MRLTFEEYFRYLNATSTSRTVVEGQSVFDAGHIILYGTKECLKWDHVFALCLQTSALSKHPHEINVFFSSNNKKLLINSATCSCTGGANNVLFEALFLSVDPYMRAMSSKLPTGIPMIGTQVSKVVESKHPGYKVGKLVVGLFGWVTHCVHNPDKLVSPFGDEAKPYILPDLAGFSPSTALGVLGMPGNTAWFGLTKLCKPKPGEVLVVTGAAGAVGSLVGQIGKILGLTVIGFAGSDDKCKILTEEMGFDFAFNYKTKDITEALAEAAPNGVDCYFDNVGGRMSCDVMNAMNTYGRVANCGSISAYNSDPKNPILAPVIQPTIMMKQLTLKGFLSNRWKDCWFEGIQQNLQFMIEGKLKFKETVVEGFENMVDAFVMLFTGDNTGKVIVKV